MSDPFYKKVRDLQSGDVISLEGDGLATVSGVRRAGKIVGDGSMMMVEHDGDPDWTLANGDTEILVHGDEA